MDFVCACDGVNVLLIFIILLKRTSDVHVNSSVNKDSSSSYKSSIMVFCSNSNSYFVMAGSF